MKYILSHRYYIHQQKPGVYTRVVGLTREHKKQIILQHIKREGFGRMEDFMDAFPELSSQDIANILQELKREELIYREGWSRSSIWRTSSGNEI